MEVLRMSDHGSLDRRGFVAGVLGAGGVLALGASNTPALAKTDPTVCSSPTPFAPGMDTRPITQRRTVVQLAADAAWLKQMNNGYAAMRKYGSSDPRSLVQQGNMHNLMCSGGAKEVHQSDRFLAWHRCFLYFQERIVGSNVNYAGSGTPSPQPPDPHFRLAVWNWEGASSTPVFPSAFTSGALLDPNRANNPSTFYSGEGNINPSLAVPATNPFRIYGYPVGSGQGGSPVLENGPHGRIHMSTGKQPPPNHDMGNLSTAALDPVFCAHHGNIDRVWAWWQGKNNNVTPNSINPQTNQPYDAAWIKNTWYFTDWDGKCYTITPASVIDYQKNLRYSYSAPPPTHAIKTLAATLQGSMLRAQGAAGAQAASLLLENVEVPAPGNGRFNLVAAVNGQARVIGRFAIFGHPMSGTSRQSVLATVDPAGAAALQAGATFRVVPDTGGGLLTARPGAGTPLKASAATLLVE
jgi:polyphenol oxidase